MRVGSISVALVILGVLGASATAAGQDAMRQDAAGSAGLVVRTLEHGEWATAIAAMQADPAAEGAPVHVVVESSGGRAPCGRYFLLLDAPGQRAFASGACDPRTHATELRLEDRSALFELGDVVARPRVVQIAAFEVRQAMAQGRAAQPARTELRCSLALRPYLRDLLSGRQVRATPERFEVRPVGDNARVEAQGDGWTVRAGSVRFEYELVDRRTDEVMLRETVAMTCERETASPSSPPARSEALTGLPIERTLRAGASAHDGRCGGAEAPEDVYTLQVEHPTWISLRVQSHFDAAIYLRNARGEELDCSVVRGQPGEVRLPRAWAQLAPGTYQVIIDGAGPPPEDGRYRLAMDFLRLR